MKVLRPLAFIHLSVCLATPLFAGFGSTETFLPAVGRAPGVGGAQIYATVWVTNLTGAPQTFTFQFLKQGQANPTPASFTDSLLPGQTKVYENVVGDKLGLSNAIGAARVTSTGEIFVSERIFNQSPGDDLGKTQGFFFAGVPKAFSISSGQSASIQGIDQGGSEDFRYNFALIETGGGSPTVNVQVFDGSGTLLGQKAYSLLPYEQILPNVVEVVPGISTTNARITATVTGGTGSVLLAGAQIANSSQDASGFDMTFSGALLGGSPGGGGLTSVIHDSTLVGSGTGASPLGINPAAVVTSLDGLHGAVTVAAGSNITVTPSGSTLTIASSGGAGGLTLPFSGNATDPNNAVFQITNQDSSGDSVGIFASSKGGAGIHGDTGGLGFGTFPTAGVVGTAPSIVGTYGVFGLVGGASVAGVRGHHTSIGSGVWGSSDRGTGVVGTSGATGSGGNQTFAIGVSGNAADIGVRGNSNIYGVFGQSGSASSENTSLNVPHAGVWGDSKDGYGVAGTSDNANAIHGLSKTGNGVFGESDSGHGVTGDSSATGINGAAIFANSTASNGIALYATNDGTDSAIVATNGSTEGFVFKGFGAGGGIPAFFVTSLGDVSAHGSISPNSLDYADRLPAASGMTPGDVVAIGSNGIIRKTTRANDSAVAGVYSTKPGVEGRDEAERRTTVPVALAGRIPVKVTTQNGPIRPGDLLVSSDVPGRAMRAPGSPAPGTVIGKAMEPLDHGAGTIEMLVMLR